MLFWLFSVLQGSVACDHGQSHVPCIPGVPLALYVPYKPPKPTVPFPHLSLCPFSLSSISFPVQTQNSIAGGCKCVGVLCVLSAVVLISMCRSATDILTIGSSRTGAAMQSAAALLAGPSPLFFSFPLVHLSSSPPLLLSSSPGCVGAALLPPFLPLLLLHAFSPFWFFLPR